MTRERLAATRVFERSAAALPRSARRLASRLNDQCVKRSKASRYFAAVLSTYLDGRHALPWPAPPPVDAPKAKPHLTNLSGVRAVLWNVYGTLLAIPFGELLFEHPQPFVMQMSLEKTIAEFKMWPSMSRKPGVPSEYMGYIYKTLLDEQRMLPSPGEKYPEVLAERVWEGVVKKLFQKEYPVDAGFYGSLNEYIQQLA